MPANILDHKMLKDLPTPVIRWIERSGMVGKEIVRTACIRQEGKMRTKPGGKWIRFKARQKTHIDKPSFLWKAKVVPAPFAFLSGRDSYFNGKGKMKIKLYGLIPLVNANGLAISQGSLVRYLAEIIWFPSAALSPYIKWEPVNNTMARAIITYSDITASGLFQFTRDGDFVNFVATRYYTAPKEPPRLETWLVKTVSPVYKEFNGVRIPQVAEITWKLKDQDFTWLKLRITDLQYN